MAHLRTIYFTFLLSSVSLAGASNPPLTIVPDNVRVCQASSDCFAKILYGRRYEAMNTPRFTVMASISREGNYLRADVSISNNSGLPLDLTPDDFRIEVLSPKVKVLTYLSPADLKNVSPSPAIPPLSAESADGAAIISPHVLEVSTEQNPSVEALYAAAKRREALQEARNRAVAEQHLAAASIAPGDTVRGRVYFENDKHAQTIHLVLPVAGLVFEFPFQVQH